MVELLESRLDALVLASAPESAMVQMLLQTPGIALFDFAQADAYTRRFGFLSAVTLPRGVVDLARDMPAADVRMVAPTATLVVRDGLHPALAQLFVQAARDVHGDSGWFQRKGDFPNARDGERALAPEAERFYRSGVPWLQRYLPFWLANLVDRMWLAMLSIVAVLLPLSRIVPPIVELRIRSRVFRWYAQLRQIESDVRTRPATGAARRARCDRRQGQRDPGAAVLHRRALRAEEPHPDGAAAVADGLSRLSTRIDRSIAFTSFVSLPIEMRSTPVWRCRARVPDRRCPRLRAARGRCVIA